MSGREPRMKVFHAWSAPLQPCTGRRTAKDPPNTQNSHKRQSSQFAEGWVSVAAIDLRFFRSCGRQRTVKVDQKMMLELESTRGNLKGSNRSRLAKIPRKEDVMQESAPIAPLCWGHFSICFHVRRPLMMRHKIRK